MAAPQSPPTAPEGNRQLTRRQHAAEPKPPKIIAKGVAPKTGGPNPDKTAKWPGAPKGRQKKNSWGMPNVKSYVAGDY
jgi:hypothetical protein